MNVLALYTLNAYIYLELQALQVLTAYQIQVKGFNSYCPLAHKINRALYGCKVAYFRLYLTDLECFETVQSIDLELPQANPFVLAYCVIHNETPYFQEFAHKKQAIQHCDSKGLGYEVLCKYASCDCNNTWFDDIVYHASITVYMTLDNMIQVVNTISIKHSTDWNDATMLGNLISDIQQGYLSTNHKPDKLYKVTVQTKIAYWYSTDKPVSVSPSLSMLVLQYLARFEIVCIEMLLFWFCQNYDPNSKVYKDASLLDETIFYHKYERYPLLYGHRHNSEIFTKGMFALTN